MNDKLRQLLEQLPSFIVLGISIVLIINLLILFLNVIMWGFLLGCGIWLLITLKNVFFSPGNIPKKHKSIIIEHNKHN